MAKRLICVLTETVHPSAMFSRIYNALFTGSSDELQFLYESLDESDRADKFIKYLEDGDPNSLPENKAKRETAFEEYVRQWKENNQPNYRSNVERNIEEEIKEMRREYESAEMGMDNERYMIKAKIENDMEDALSAAVNNIGGVFNSIRTPTIDGIKGDFEPLRYKLRTAKETYPGAVLGLVRVSGWIFESKASRNAGRALDDGWFDRISQCLIQYITEPESSLSNHNVCTLLRGENLEKDIEHFRDCLGNWLTRTKSELSRVNKQIQNLPPVGIGPLEAFLEDLLNRLRHLPEKSFHLPKISIREPERMSKFFHALMLNDPAMLHEHQELFDSMIQDAARTDEGQLPPNCKSSLMPLISFGQLPLSGGSTSRMIRLKFVLDISYSHTKAQEVLEEVSKMFENVRKSEIVQENGVRVINLDIQILGNIPQYIFGLVIQAFRSPHPSSFGGRVWNGDRWIIFWII